MPQGRYKVKFINGKPALEKQTPSEQDKNVCGEVEHTESSLKFIPNDVDQTFDKFFEEFVKKVLDLRLSKKILMHCLYYVKF